MDLGDHPVPEGVMDFMEGEDQEEEEEEEDLTDIHSPFSPASPQIVEAHLPPLLLYKTITADKLTDLNIEEVYKKWLECLESGHLNEESTLEMLREYWLKVVPHVYRLEANQDCLSPFGESGEVADKYLIDPLAYFITGGHCGADGIQDYLMSSDQPPTVCGRVFQVGEATYSCRECGMDPTCVLCADCFKNSAHKSHKYKIATSSGGGYCDCGDLEAWKNHVHCEYHKPKSPTDAHHDTSIQEGFENRAKVLLPSLLLYSFELTANELDRHMPISFDVEEKETDKSGAGLFCTVLYNDETHTFDLVIQTLTRALQCTKKDAIEFATTIDREGRSIVKVGGFTPCHEAQKIIERSTAGRAPNAKSLKCSVMKREVVQHQAFALHLLSWIETLCTNSLAIRRVIQNVFYCRGDGLVLCADSTKSSWLIDAVLLNDTKLWKAARSCWHRLIIAGLLKEYDSKRTFSEVFTREYASIMDDFIRDDHDHSYSVTSLSVQIFTVPSIAHYLVETIDVIYSILRVLLAQCTTRLNILGKLEFERGAVIATTSFKRTNFAILDLKYILTNPPTDWSPLMVKNFTHGIDSFLKFLSYMQEMDAVTRQVGSHMEYEPEWESAFNLHIKLQPVVQLSLEWCGLNKPVFVRAFRHCLHDLSKAYDSLKTKTVVLELANHAATCYVYDIATQPVSVHLPLTRYFAGLYLHLEKFDLHFFSSEFNLLQTEKPVPEMIMEPALRTQVLIAQVNASMWKRNGYALLNQLYFYHNVRCRNDMLDKDIVTLQIAASVIESNEFLLHVINRFGLYHWVQSGFDEKVRMALKPEGQEEDFSKYLGTLTEEFLGLLITLLSARFTPGVGQVERADAIRKEVIQQLCIEPMTHSTLNKCLVENVNLETGLELVIHTVANQRGPTPQRSSVVYELKPELYADYDVYHYHYTREEMSKAEESQRARKKAAKEPEIFPPPKLPPFTAMFDMLVNFLQCDVFLYVINLVLSKSLHKSSRLSESLVRKALHLIGHGLNEEQIRNQREAGHFFQFTHSAEKWKIFEHLDKMLQDSTLSQHHSMILWLRKQYNIIKPQMQNVEEALVVQPEEEEEKKRKADKMKEAKEKMMARMAAAQKKFMLVNKDLFSEEPGTETNEPEASLEDSEMTPVDTVAVGPNQSPSHLGDEKYICILCQEEQTLAIGGKRFVLACFIQRSTVMAQYRQKLVEESTVEYQLYYNVKPPKGEIQNSLYLNSNLNCAPVMTTCGHIMHDSCWNSHIETVHNKERRRPYRLRHPLSFDVDKAEWLCPMCDSICNAALPMAVHLPKMYPTPSFSWYSDVQPTRYDSRTSDSFGVWAQGLQIVMKHKEATKIPLQVSAELSCWNHNFESMPANIRVIEMVAQPLPKILKDMEEVDVECARHFESLFPTRVFQENNPTLKWLNSGFHTKLTAFMTLNFNTSLLLEIPKEDDFRMLLEMWSCLSYTIISSEAFHRDQNLPFFGEEVPLRRAIGIKYLTRACGVACDRTGYWTDYMRSFALKLLSMLLQNPSQSPSMCVVDAFGLLVSLTFAMPSLFVYHDDEKRAVTDPKDGTTPLELCCQPPNGGRQDHHLLRLTYMFHITQILMSNDFSHCVVSKSKKTDPAAEEVEEMDMETDVENPDPNKKVFVARKEYLFKLVWKVAKKYCFFDFCDESSTLTEIFKNVDNIDCNLVWESVKTASLPFLRCCAKFYESLTGIAAPFELETVESSFDALMKYLDLPTEFEDLFNSPFSWQIPYKWASHPDVYQILHSYIPEGYSYPMPPIRDSAPDALDSSLNSSMDFDFLSKNISFPYPRSLTFLTPLPEDYTELINMVSNFTCKNSKTLDSRTPTMCLLCGTILCSQSYCCQREIKSNVVIGSCMYHANFCGGGSGIFLRIRECKLFFTHGQNRGCFYQPPYLDEYGEPDQGLRRGNPLKLSKEKYEAIRKIWISHAIPEEIARTTEHSVAVAATEWQYL